MAYKNINSGTVKEMIEAGGVQVIDVREAYEYAMGHIEEAELISLNTIPNNMDKISKDKKIILVCASGARSTSASNYLAQQGYEVYNMVGGMMGWRYPVAR